MNTRMLLCALAERAGTGPVRGRDLDIRSMVLGVAVAFCLLAPVDGATLKFLHQYEEIVDHTMIYVHIDSDSNDYVCLVEMRKVWVGNKLTFHVRKTPPYFYDEGCAVGGATGGFHFGPLKAGNYEIAMHVWSIDYATVESLTRPLQVLPLEGRCNRDPLLSPSIIGYRKEGGMALEDFVKKVSTDASFAATLGNPSVALFPEGHAFGGHVFGGYHSVVGFTYPPLDGITPALHRLPEASGLTIFPLLREQCAATPVPDVVAAVVEYFHASRDHYFYTGDAGEIAAIDAGRVGPGWVRTGKSFNAVTAPGCPFAHGQSMVYRFNGIPGKGPDSHFFTRDRAECYVVDKSTKWSFEGLPFWASAPNADGTCDPLPSAGRARVPLYRAWRPVGDSNHRFSTDRAVIDEMVTKGWVNEGPVMCVLGSN